MRIGLALPHYDFSLPGQDGPLAFETIADYARLAESLGFDSLWVSDHVTLSIAKYGGGPGEHFAYEPLTTLAALAGVVRRPRLGTLVLCAPLRPAAVLAKALATLDRISGGRLDIGIGAGWSATDYAAVGREVPSPGQQLRGLEEALTVLDGLLRGDPVTFSGTEHRAEAAESRPAAIQSPRPPLIVGGKGDRLLALAARRADAWNTCWIWTPEDWSARAAVLDRACEAAGRDPATVRRTLGLYALAGEDDGDLRARWERMQRSAPNGMLDKVTLDEWRTGRLVGTVAEIAEQAANWAARGIDELIVSAGPLPFSVSDRADVELLARALGKAS
jgi:probable F420-dependent oxidoreductase